VTAQLTLELMAGNFYEVFYMVYSTSTKLNTKKQTNI